MGLVSLLPFLFAFSKSSSTRKLAKLDLEQFEIKKVQVLPREYKGKIVFEFPTMQEGGTSSHCMDGMDLGFDGHPWCKRNNISMNNFPFGVKCCKVFCA